MISRRNDITRAHGSWWNLIPVSKIASSFFSGRNNCIYSCQRLDLCRVMNCSWNACVHDMAVSFLLEHSYWENMSNNFLCSSLPLIIHLTWRLWVLKATARGPRHCLRQWHWCVHKCSAFAHEMRPLSCHGALSGACVLCSGRSGCEMNRSDYEIYVA